MGKYLTTKAGKGIQLSKYVVFAKKKDKSLIYPNR